MLQSSTPDGLAPLSHDSVLIFSFTLSALPLLWGVACLVMLLRQFNEGEAEANDHQIFNELCRKVLRVAL